MQQITGRIVDIFQQRIYKGQVTIVDGKIQAINTLPEDADAATAAPLPYILPGFVDAHVHIESSLLIPSEFARLAVVHGTVATVSDPHEIANVCGLPGIEFMIRNGQSVPFHFNFGAPSCVPATAFETAGAVLDAAKVDALLQQDNIKYLSEMMNFPGVLNKDPEVLAKIASAQRLGKPVDGHAPGLRGKDAQQYIAAGISTDHECYTAEEALEKLQYGMKILIREGSAARNFEALIGLMNEHFENMMFCSDDKHPDSLLAGHINQLCARAVAKGIDVFKVLQAACINPVLHYKLDVGLLRVGDAADLVVVEDLESFRVVQTYIKGIVVAASGQSHIASSHIIPAAPPVSGTSMLEAAPINNFHADPHVAADFTYPLDKWGEEENVEQVYVIGALDGQLITDKIIVPVKDVQPVDGLLRSNIEKDILKIVVINRYIAAPVAKSFIRGFGLRRGALASSVAHDSHNIVAVGVDDESICRAVNLVIAQKGGLACVDPGTGPVSAPPAPGAGATTPAPAPPPFSAITPTIPGDTTDPLAPSATELILPLPVAGLMSLDDGFRVAETYTAIDQLAKTLGSPLGAPFMTLSFMSLLVIPSLKLSDLGLFDGEKFRLL